MKKFVSLLLTVSVIMSTALPLKAGIVFSENEDTLPFYTGNSVITEDDIFVPNEVLASADSLEHAREIADEYGLELKSYAYGVAVLATNQPKQAVANSMETGISSGSSNAGKALPLLSLNYIYKTAIVKKGPITEGYINQTDGSPSDPDFNQQYFHEDMDNIKAWDITTGLPNVVVAVIDTGIDIYHPEFENKISPKSYNAHSNQAGIQYVTDDDNHGTHVSGIIAAVGENGVGGLGVAPEVTIMTIKANIPNTDSFETASLVRGINYAAENGANVINMSLSRPYLEGETLQEKIAIANAVAKGVVIVCAAGNENSGNAGYPAAYEDCIAVSALKQGGQFDFSYSNLGSEIDISAPGTEIFSTVRNGYASFTGTSMASPNVAGTAALIKSQNPSFTVAQIKDKLYNSAKDSGISGFDTMYGHGVVNSYNALAASDKLFTVTFRHNSGLSGNDFTTKTAAGGKLFKVTPKPRRGYTFGGWYKESQCINAFDSADEIITSDTEIYAKWLFGELEAPKDDFVYDIKIDESGEYAEIQQYTGSSDVVVIPAEIEGKPIKSIGVRSFMNRPFMNKAVIPDGVTTISGMAFYGCTNLETIVIPDSAVDMTECSFDGTKWFNDQQDGMVYAGKVAYRYKVSDSIIPKHITLKEGTLGIASYAFNVFNDYGYIIADSDLVSIDLPDSLAHISNYAFSSCSKLEEIRLPGNVKKIGEGAFLHCASLKEVIIPDKTEEIENYAFQDCTSLRRLYISKGVKRLGSEFICYCFSLENLYAASENEYYKDVNGVLYTKDGKTVLLYPTGRTDGVYVIAPGTEMIANFAFRDCRNLSNVIFPEGLISIGWEAFSDCKRLISVTIPETVSQAPYSFSGCDSLESVYFMGDEPIYMPGAFTAYARGEQDNLIRVSLPNLTIYYINGKNGFTTPTWQPTDNPEYKTQIFDGVEKAFIAPRVYIFSTTSETQGDVEVFLYKSIYELTSITLNGNSLFEGTDYTVSGDTYTLKKQTLLSLNSGKYDCVFNLSGGNSLVMQLTIDDKQYTPAEEFVFVPATRTIVKYTGTRREIYIPPMIGGVLVEEIGDNAFENGYSIKSVIMPDTVTKIGNYAFYCCVSLENVNIPNGVKYIGMRAFALYGNCVLEELNIPAATAYIGYNAFEGASALKAINVDPKNVCYTSEGGVLYTIAPFYESGGIRYAGNADSLVKYPPMKSEAFYEIPKRIKILEDSAIENEFLENIILPEGLTVIESNSIACPNLKKIDLPESLTFIGDGAFSMCRSLEELFIPQNVNYIGILAFPNYEANLKAIYVDPRNITYCDVDGVLFSRNMTELIKYPSNKAEKSYFIPTSVTDIENSAFKECGYLESVNIPDGVTSIGNEAFSGCGGITSITLPDSVASIGEWAFSGCTGLTFINFKSPTPPLFGAGCFYDTINLTAIYVPVGAKSAYEAEPQLSGHNIIEHSDDCTVPNCVLCNRDPNRIYCACCALDNQFVAVRGHVLANPNITIFDALEILKALVNMDGAIAKCPNAKIAALIIGESQGIGEPSIFDALEVLKKLVNMDNKIDNPSVIS